MSEISKSLGAVGKWSGKYALFSLILALILTAVTISLADPSVSDIYLQSTGTQDKEFTVSDRRDVQILVVPDEGDTVEITLYKLIFKEPGANETTDFSSSPNDTIQTTEIFRVSIDDGLYRIVELSPGEYRLTVTNTDSTAASAFVGHANFNIGLISATVILYVIFSILVSVFSIAAPLYLITLLATSDLKRGPIGDQSVDRTKSGKSKYQSEQASQKVSSGKLTSGSATKVDMFDHTPFRKLTKKDWTWVVIGTIFFFIYLSNPFDSGPLLVIAMIIYGGVGYSYFEREKTKDRLTILLQSYPKSSIAFMAEQLDKDEDHVIKVLRILILDEGYPIKLDLVNRTVTKVGSFPRETSVSGQSTTVSDSQSSTTAEDRSKSEASERARQEDEPTETTSEEVSTSSGSIKEPWEYCHSCGEGLIQEVTYCYSCGARQ